MKLASRFGAALIGIFLILFLFLMIVRAVDEFDPMAAAIIWTIGGLLLALVMLLAARPGKKAAKPKPSAEDDEPSEMDMQ